MLYQELEYIANRRNAVFGNGKLSGKDAEKNLVGLCLSGGGIRSATFNLGMIQALFRKNLLQYVDYLSTVSGGGYIGACITSLLNSTPKRQGDYKYVFDKKYFPFEKSQLNKDKAAVKWLRYFSNYLTAEGGFIDKYFKPAMVFLRGLITNSLVTIPYVLLVSILLLFVFHDDIKVSTV